MRTILFICEGNAARSQEAEAYLRIIRPDLNITSAGTKAQVSYPVPPMIVQVMGEDGVALCGAYRKLLTPDRVDAADFIISFLPPDELPEWVKVDRFWSVVDPRGHEIDFHREVRDRIKNLAEGLADELK